MAVPQQKFREIVFQLLYCFDVGQNQGRDVGPLIQNLVSVPKGTIEQAMERTRAIVAQLKELDALIGASSKDYRFERIQVIDRNILRLGIFELMMDDAIPAKVAIAEALRLAQKFSTAESVTFINAVLDLLYKETLRGGQAGDQRADTP